MRGRNFRYMKYPGSSYSAFGLLARHGLLHFCRVVNVIRDGRIVKRHVTSPDLKPEERARLSGSPSRTVIAETYRGDFHV